MEMKAFTRNGQEIKVGHKYMFANTYGNTVYTVIEIIDADAVRVNDHWKSSRWACNALYEVG